MLQWVYKFTGTNDFRSFVAHCLSHEAHPFIQFCKYVFAGGLATLAYLLVFSLSNELVFPAGKELEAKVRWINYTLSCSLAFFFSNFVAYVVNIKWVFKPGRHSRRKEVFLFLMASFVAFLIGTPLGAWIVANYDAINEYLALGVTIVASVMVNYTARKFFIFKG